MRLLLLLYFANLSQGFTRILPTNVIYYGKRLHKPLHKPLLCQVDGEVEWPELDTNYNKYKLYNDIFNISYTFGDDKLNKTGWKNYNRKGNND